MSDGFLVAPTEPPLLKTLGISSTLPETYGADILFPHKGAFVGVQRKELSDLIASVHDGRLGKELAQLQRCLLAVLIVEGRAKWSTDGVLVRSHGAPWTRTKHLSVLLSVQLKHVWVLETESTAGTMDAIHHLRTWLGTDNHGLRGRPGPVSPWGRADNQDWACHLLQGFEGVGPEVARRIVERFGRPPLAWTVTEKELMEVDGVGVKRAKRLVEAL